MDATPIQTIVLLIQRDTIKSEETYQLGALAAQVHVNRRFAEARLIPRKAGAKASPPATKCLPESDPIPVGHHVVQDGIDGAGTKRERENRKHVKRVENGKA